MEEKRHANSKIITIYRSGSFLQRAQAQDAAPYMSLSKDGVGSYFEGKGSAKIGSGLSIEEEELLMPVLVDASKEDRDFRKKVSEFFIDINTDVPFETGVRLEVGLSRDNNKPVAKDNMPLNLMDFVRYRHALKHPHTAASKELSMGNQMKRFYIFDKSLLQSRITQKTKEQDKALQYYLQVKNDPEQVDQMLLLLGVEPRKFDDMVDGQDLKIEELKSLANTKSGDFIRVFDEGEMEIRAMVANMVNAQVLKKMGNRYVDPEMIDDEQTRGEIGKDIEEVIYFFKLEENSGKKMVLNARLQEALAKPVRKTQSRRTVLK